MSIKYRPKVSIKCSPAQAVAQLSKILECAHSGADYHCKLEKKLSLLKSALADSKCSSSSNFLDVWLRGRFWLGLVKKSWVGGVGVICVCGSSMDAKMKESVECGFCEQEEETA